MTKASARRVDETSVGRGFLRSLSLFFAALLMSTRLMAAATTVAAISDPGSVGGPGIFGQVAPPFSGGGQFGVESWTTSQTYTDVTISATLALFGNASTGNSGTYHGQAYLTNSIGPGA